MSSTTTQPPSPLGEGLPASLYILAAALCVLGFIALVYLYFTRFAHVPPMQQHQHGSTVALNKRILDTTSESEATWLGCCPRVNMCIMSRVLTRGLPPTHPVLRAARTASFISSSVVIIFLSPAISSTFSDHFRPMSPTTTQPSPPPGEGLPASLYILAAALCVLGFIALVYLYFTRWFAYAPPMQQQQHGSTATLNKRILDTLPKVT
ncbi:hypothetical protein Tco_1456824 [Tanacetum coccineum]